MSAQPIEIRMAHLEGAYEQVSHRLNCIELRLEQQFAGVERRFIGLDERMERMEHRIDQKFLWVIGLVLVSMILPLVERFVPH